MTDVCGNGTLIKYAAGNYVVNGKWKVIQHFAFFLESFFVIGGFEFAQNTEILWKHFTSDYVFSPFYPGNKIRSMDCCWNEILMTSLASCRVLLCLHWMVRLVRQLGCLGWVWLVMHWFLWLHSFGWKYNWHCQLQCDDALVGWWCSIGCI